MSAPTSSTTQTKNIPETKNKCPQHVLDAIRNVVNTEEIVKQGVPKDFQIIVRPLLKSVYDYTLKLHHIAESITRIEKHGRENTFPPQILGAIKQPKFQSNKNFDSTAGNTWNTDSQEIVCQARKALLRNLLSQKREEMEMMKIHASIDKALKKGLNDLNDFHAKMISHIAPDNHSTNTIAISLSNNVQSLRYSYRELLLKAAFLANGDYTRSLVKKVSKAERKKDTDVQMANTTPSDIQTTIDAAVKRAVQALSKNKKTNPKTAKSRKGPLKAKPKKVLKPRRKIGKPRTGPLKKIENAKGSGKGKKNVK